VPEFSHFSYLIILFLYSDKKNLVEQKNKFSKNNNHSCIQMTKQHLSIKFEGAVIFLA